MLKKEFSLKSLIFRVILIQQEFCKTCCKLWADVKQSKMWPNVNRVWKIHRTVLFYSCLPKFILNDSLEVYKIKIDKICIKPYTQYA